MEKTAAAAATQLGAEVTTVHVCGRCPRHLAASLCLCTVITSMPQRDPLYLVTPLQMPLLNIMCSCAWEVKPLEYNSQNL